jgi:myo-inositol-1-phosphate synthase
MPAVFDQKYVRRLDGPNVKPITNKWDQAQAVREDIRKAIETSGADRAVMIWCGSTEVYLRPTDCHQNLETFERGLKESDPAIAPSQIYAYAALMEGVPYANGAPNTSADTLALEALALDREVPVAGKDFKTGQTLMKTILAPGLKARMLGIEGWYSTNILGNRDGEVLDDPDSFKAKEVTKAGVLDILQKELYPQLYGDLYHKISINYYPPRGDAKEGWDNIDILAGSGIRCRSRSTSCVAIRSWPRPSFSTWRCSSICRAGPAGVVSRSGCRSTSRARTWPPGTCRSTTCSSSTSGSRTPCA